MDSINTTTNFIEMNEKDFNKQFKHHTARVNGIRMHYVLGGKGKELVVLLHGFPQTWNQWRKVMPTLSEKYTVLAPDLRGLGDTEKTDGGYDKLTLAKDIHGLIQHLGYDKLYLVGHDWGMTVGYLFASAFPDMVKKLVLMDAVMPGAGWRELMDNWNGKGLWHFTFNAIPNLPEALVAGRERLIIEWFFKELTYNPSAISEEDIQLYTQKYQAPGAMHAGFNWYRTVPEDAAVVEEYRKKKLLMPVLGMAGAQGTGDLIVDVVEPLAENFQSLIIDECGHYIPDEKPEELSKALIHFFN